MSDAYEKLQSQRTEADLSWDLKRPCADCPFRRTAEWHSGIAERAILYMGSIEQGGFVHTCHKTDPRTDSPQGQQYEGPLQVCRGSLIMLTKSGRGADLQRPILRAIDAGKLDVGELAEAARTDTECCNLAQFYAATADGLERCSARFRNRRRNQRPGRKRK